MKIIITKLHPEAVIPKYQTLHSAGMDLVACMKDPKTLAPLERAVIPTGIAIALPDGYEAQVRTRSGLAAKHGIGLSNGVGTIDADYRGEVGVLITNFGQEPFVVEPGMRIAQMVVARYERAELELVEELPVSDRGVGGFGSTGTR